MFLLRRRLLALLALLALALRPAIAVFPGALAQRPPPPGAVLLAVILPAGMPLALAARLLMLLALLLGLTSRCGSLTRSITTG